MSHSDTNWLQRQIETTRQDQASLPVEVRDAVKRASEAISSTAADERVTLIPLTDSSSQ